jgi:TonB-dependent receptor
MRRMSKVFLPLICFLVFIVSFVSAQNGKIVGFIFDSQYNDPLPGANVYIEGTSYGAAADLNGKYSIVGVPEGDYQLTVKYIGYVDKTIDVTVAAGETVEKIITLDFQSIEGEVIEVNAQAEGQMQAINQQLSSNTIANVVSKARIEDIPDVNAAESVGRLPGISINRSGGEATQVTIRGLSPKYNTVSVNGVRMPSTDSQNRSADLSLISSSMLEGIEVKKAVTPDMDADALGGAVDLKLKVAADKFEAHASLLGGYNQIQDYYGNYNFNGQVSNRFLDGRLGIIAGFNHDSYDRTADKFDGVYTFRGVTGTSNFANYFTDLTLTEESRVRGRTGGNLLMDYKIPGGKIQLSSFYNQLRTKGLNRIYDYGVEAGRLYYDLREIDNTTSIFSGDLGFEKDLDWIKIDGGFSVAKSLSESPDELYWRFVLENGGFSVPGFAPLTKPRTIPGYLRPDSLNTAFQDAYIWDTNRKENQQAFQLNIQMPFSLGDFSGFIKTGAKLRNLDRRNDQERTGRNGIYYGNTDIEEKLIAGNPNWRAILTSRVNGEIVKDTVSALELTLDEGRMPIQIFRSDYNRSNFLDGDYPMGYNLNHKWLVQLTRTLVDSGESIRYSVDSRGQDYDGYERYRAWYIMGEFKYGQHWTLIPGIRMEYDYSKYHGQSFREATVNNIEGPPADLKNLTNVRENTFWLPMVHLRYEPLDWLKIRLARTETISRPDFYQYAPITHIDSYQQYMRAANANLKPAHSANLDASVSVYQNYVGLFTVSAFQKKIDDLIFQTRYNFNRGVPIPEGFNIPDSWIHPPSGPAPTPAADLFINNPYTASYSGFEFDWQTHFWYLPSFLNGLVFNINYTHLNSKTRLRFFKTQVDTIIYEGRNPVTYYDVVDTSRVIRMPDQPGDILNLTLGYDFKGFSIRLSYLFEADNLLSSGTRQLDTKHLEDTYSADYKRWDLTVQQRVTEQVQLFANFTNFAATPDKILRGKYTREDDYIEYYGAQVDLGLRYKF